VTIPRAAIGRFFTLGMLLLVLPARAHHSASMFDMQNELTLTGTVREFQFTNPHCWIQLAVPENGIAGEWSIQLGAPIQVFQGGWNSHTLKPGDQIKVTFHPMRDGTKGGNFISATGADGQHLGKAL
jgi:hypothetical protein